MGFYSISRRIAQDSAQSDATPKEFMGTDGMALAGQEPAVLLGLRRVPQDADDSVGCAAAQNIPRDPVIADRSVAHIQWQRVGELRHPVGTC